MENKRSKLIAGLAAACVLAFRPAASGAVGYMGYKDLSAQLLRCAETNELKKIAVLEFAARGGAGSLIMKENLFKYIKSSVLLHKCKNLFYNISANFLAFKCRAKACGYSTPRACNYI